MTNFAPMVCKTLLNIASAQVTLHFSVLSSPCGGTDYSSCNFLVCLHCICMVHAFVSLVFNTFELTMIRSSLAHPNYQVIVFWGGRCCVHILILNQDKKTT